MVGGSSAGVAAESGAASEHGDAAATCPMHVQHAAPVALTQPGQPIFGAVREVLDRLESDPTTDWSSVDLDALRAHLVQMDLLFRQAQVAREQLADGMRYRVRGAREVLDAANAIGSMHARRLADEAPSWRMEVDAASDEVVIDVRSDDPSQHAKIRGLGFAGFFALGSHHSMHHWAMATGGVGHQH